MITRSVQFHDNAITMEQHTVFYNAITFQVRGQMYVAAGQYTCNVANSGYWYPGLVYLSMTDAEKIFPGCRSLADGSTIMGYYTLTTSGQPALISIIKYSSNSVQFICSLVRGSSSGERITISTSIIIPPTLQMKAAAYIQF